MRPVIATAAARRHRGDDEEDPAFALDVDAEVARRRIAEKKAVERACPACDGGATGQDEWRRDEETVPRRATEATEQEREDRPEVRSGHVHRHREEGGQDRPDGIAREQQPGHPARRATAAKAEDKDRGGDRADERQQVARSRAARQRSPTGSRIPIAAPRAAPDEVPSTYGSASGFLTMPWKVAPATASPAPTTAAVRTRGRRRSQTIVSVATVQRCPRSRPRRR